MSNRDIFGNCKNEQTFVNGRYHLNYSKYDPHSRLGHHESYYQRANHPTKPLAFWIRYTMFSPENNPQDAHGNLWGIFFNGESNKHYVIKDKIPAVDCTLGRYRFFVKMRDNILAPGIVHGLIKNESGFFKWDLEYHTNNPPLLLLDEPLYNASWLKSKNIVGFPLASFNGNIIINDQHISIDNWLGSQNHYWGSKHTDYYAWGQVAGFDNAPNSFLEVGSARLRFKSIQTPWLTPIVLYHDGCYYKFNTVIQAAKSKVNLEYFTWTFETEDKNYHISGKIYATAKDFVALRYANPPGGFKDCLNSKIASCSLTLTKKDSGQVISLHTKHRAAFEILTDDTQHGIDRLL